MGEDRFGLDDLTDDEALAFGALLRAMVSMDGVYSDKEKAAIEVLAGDLGNDAFRAMLDRAEKEVSGPAEILALADGVQRPEARELIFYGVHTTAQAGSGTGVEQALLDELRRRWNLPAGEDA